MLKEPIFEPHISSRIDSFLISWWASRLLGRNIPCLLMNRKVHYRDHKSLLLHHIPNQATPVHKPKISCFRIHIKICFNLHLRLRSSDLPSGFRVVCTSALPHECPSYPPSLDHPNNIKWKAEVSCLHPPLFLPFLIQILSSEQPFWIDFATFPWSSLEKFTALYLCQQLISGLFRIKLVPTSSHLLWFPYLDTLY
jgi:hypothetical protein